MSNPYDLSRRKKVGPRVVRRPTEYTTEEKRGMLAGFTELDAKYWPNLMYNRHIRYTETSEAGGGFKSAFVVRGQLLAEDPASGQQTPRLELQNRLYRGNGQGYNRWQVPHANVAHLYAKMSAIDLRAHDDLVKVIETLNSNIRKLKRRTTS